MKRLRTLRSKPTPQAIVVVPKESPPVRVCSKCGHSDMTTRSICPTSIQGGSIVWLCTHCSFPALGLKVPLPPASERVGRSLLRRVRRKS